jgi:uncharacterized membrane protein YedE/YeeE
MKNFKQLAAATLAGALFGLGLVVSGMTQTAKVTGFLNLGGLFDAARFGAWDPSLAFVMGGAVCVTLLAFAITPATTAKPSRKPWLAATFQLPTRQDIDTRLLLGAALFGIGWGLVGYCPGPALATVLTGGMDAIIFAVALVCGMGVAKRFAT